MPVFYLLFAVIVWGWSFVATKICLEAFTPVELLGLRLLIGVPILFLVARQKRARLEFTPPNVRALVLGAIIITAHFLIQITGLKYTSATNTGWIISITPLVTALLSYLFLKEEISRNAILGIVVATFGIFLLMSHGDLTNLDWLKSVGDWLVLISAHTWAIYTVVTRNITKSQSPLAVTIGVMLPATVLIGAYTIFTLDWSAFLHLQIRVYVALGVLAILATALAHWFWQEGVRGIGAARAGIFLYLEPISTTLLAVPLLDERFSVFTGIGGAMVLAGVYIAQRRNQKSA